MRHLQNLCFFIMLLSVALPLSAFDTSQEALNYLKEQKTASIEKSLTQQEKKLLKEIQAAEAEDIDTLVQKEKKHTLKLAKKVQNRFKKSKSPFYKTPLAFMKKYKKTSIGCIFLLLLVLLRQSSLQERFIFIGGFSTYFGKITGGIKAKQAEKDNPVSKKILDDIETSYKNMSIEIKPYETEDGAILYGSHFKHLNNTNTKNRKVIFFCHGNAQNIFHRYDLCFNIAMATKCDLFIASYPGYGINEGKITSEEKFYGAVERGFEYVTSESGLGYTREKTILLGCSLGSAANTHIAAKYNPAALCLACPFLSIPDFLSGIKMIVRPLLRYTINNREKIKEVTCPIFIGHDRNDETIPFSHGKELYDIAQKQNGTQSIQFMKDYKGGHCIAPSFINEMTKFINQLPS